jgi:hypothetical protein
MERELPVATSVSEWTFLCTDVVSRSTLSSAFVQDYGGTGARGYREGSWLLRDCRVDDRGQVLYAT